MCTATLVGLQLDGNAHTPLCELGMMTNAFAHVWMYAYFAHPHSWSRPMRRGITVVQVTQHVIMFAAIVTSMVRKYIGRHACVMDPTGNLVPLALYLYFVIEFAKLL